jgi:hypothetical protein
MRCAMFTTQVPLTLVSAVTLALSPDTMLSCAAPQMRCLGFSRYGGEGDREHAGVGSHEKIEAQNLPLMPWFPYLFLSTPTRCLLFVQLPLTLVSAVTRALSPDMMLSCAAPQMRCLGFFRYGRSSSLLLVCSVMGVSAAGFNAMTAQYQCRDKACVCPVPVVDAPTLQTLTARHLW